MKKQIFILIIVLLPVLAMGQSRARQGLIVGKSDNAVAIDSIISEGGVLKFYVGATLTPPDLGTDTIPIDTIAHMLVDTLDVVFGLGSGIASDTIVFQTGAVMGAWYILQDSIILDSIYAKAYGDDCDAEIQIQSGTLNSESPTVHATLSIPNATASHGTSTFTAGRLNTERWIWCELTDITVGKRPTLLVVNLFYHEKRKY